MGLSSTISEINENRKFSQPRVAYLAPPLEGVPLELGIIVRSQKIE